MARRRRAVHWQAIIGTIPMIAVAVGLYIVGIAFTFFWSLTNTKIFPSYQIVGFSQYDRLWSSDRWLVAVNNVWFFGILSIASSLTFGYLLAVFMDQRIKQEDLLRSIFLYPFAMSLIVTGLVWQWILDPNFGLNEMMHGLGWTSFHFSPLVDTKTAIYGLVVASVWQGSGFTMAVLLSGLRGIDSEIWKAAKVDGIPAWRTHLFIALPMMRGAVATAFVFQAVGVVRVYDLIVAMTGGGPGISTSMPAVYVISMISNSQNAGQGSAAAVMLLIPVMVIVGSFFLWQWWSERREAKA